MRSRTLFPIIFASAFACSAFCQATRDTDPSGPFGFFAGETREQIIAAVGRDHVVKTTKDVLEVSTAPKPFSEFESYSLIIPTNVGLVKVIAVGRNIENDSYGRELSERYDRIKAAITKHYGNPSQNFSYLRQGSIWDEPKDFAMALTKKDREMSTFWGSDDEREMTSGVVAIKLTGKGLSASTCYVTVGYELVGFSKYFDRKTQSEDSAL